MSLCSIYSVIEGILALGLHVALKDCAAPAYVVMVPNLCDTVGCFASEVRIFGRLRGHGTELDVYLFEHHIFLCDVGLDQGQELFRACPFSK